MFKYTINYEDYIGNPQQETLRFNLTESELRDLVRHDKTFDPDILSKIKEDEDAGAMLDIIRKLIAVSFGVLSEDAKHFRKSEEITRDFLESCAYEAFMNTLLQSENPNTISDFIIGVFPARYAQELRKRADEATSITG